MTNFNTALFVALATAAASCAGQENDRPDATSADTLNAKNEVVPHLKSGAAVRFNHEMRAAVDAGEDGVVELIIDERYDEGRLDIEAVATGGVSLSASSASTSMALAGTSRHIWDIYFTAEDNGVHYIDVRATVTVAGDVVGSRSYSVPVKVGNAAAPSAKSSAKVDRDADGNPIIIMEAEETGDE